LTSNKDVKKLDLNHEIDEFTEDYDIYQSKLLKSKMNRVQVESNVNALLNRVSMLEREEEKLLGKIDETTKKALSIIKVKENSFFHKDILDSHRQKISQEKETIHMEVQSMRKKLREKSKSAKRENVKHASMKAEDVK